MVASIWVEVNAELTVPANTGDTGSAGVAVIRGTPADATLIVRACDTMYGGMVAGMVAEMLIGKLPLREGVPVICPVPALKLSPVGRVPDWLKAEGDDARGLVLVGAPDAADAAFQTGMVVIRVSIVLPVNDRGLDVVRQAAHRGGSDDRRNFTGRRTGAS